MSTYGSKILQTRYNIRIPNLYDYIVSFKYIVDTYFFVYKHE